MSIDSKQLRNLSRIYQEAVYGGGKKETPKDTRMVVTAADKKANTKAYQNYKAGNKAYKAADHMKEQKKAAKDYDGDGKVESGKEEYFGSRDKAIKKAMGKKVKESFSNWRHDLKEIPNYEQIPVSGKARNEKISEKNVKNSIKINPEMKEEYGKKKKKKGHHCASKVKHEEFGIGRCIPEAHDLDEYGNVAHYDVEFEEYIVENCPVEELEVLEEAMHEHVIRDFELWLEQKEENKIKNCGCGQNPCVTYGSKKLTPTQEVDEQAVKGYQKGGMVKGYQKGGMVKGYQKGGMVKKGVKEQVGTYEKQKTKEVMGALKKRDLKQDVKKKIAADIVKRKGDTSKSDDRYAYEGYQRNPEKGEEESRKAKRERKGGYDEKRERRMNDPKTGINSPAFQEFMRSRGM